MKKLIYILIAVIGFAASSSAQDKKEIANSKGDKELRLSKESGAYSFILPEGLTKEDIEKNTKYYTHYFTVAFDENSNVATINMVSNEPKSRIVIARFLSACGVRYVEVGNKNITLDELIQNYLR